MTFPSRRAALAGALAATLPGRAHAQARTVTDMAKRRVTLPARITRVVTLGSLPVLNSFVYAMGEAATLVNGLADFARPHWKFQSVFAPQLPTLPAMQLPTREPNVEAILLARPDVVLTMHRESVDQLASRGIPVVFLAWRRPEDVKTCMTVLGEVFANPARAAAYTDYFDRTIARVAAIVQGAPPPRVLYLQPDTLTQPRLIAEWWIPTAGGISVSADGRSTESRGFTLEQVVLWDPDILIVTAPKDVAHVNTHPVFKQLKAVRSRRVLVVPVGAHTWSNRTAEQPLTVLWAASVFHPVRMRAIDLAAETHAFYRDIFGHALTDAQVGEILGATM
ncbi:MAG: ABC transporter substrate-binding protein [Acetobacteraceae bacterium]|nr:ABC transporter substrate-binding protein [Acetobacteraceae bacterium]